jgi:DNA repair protein RecO (recombination protein O)
MGFSSVYTVEGVVLKRRTVGEADRIITIFTKQYGKMRVLAKGIRRITSRRAGHVELFNHVVLTLHRSKTLDIVTEAQSMRHGTNSLNPLHVAYSYCICELIDQLLPDQQEHQDVFFLLSDAMEKLHAAVDHEVCQSIMSEFTHELLWCLGFLPHARQLAPDTIQSYVESITERRLKTWPLLTAFRGTS